MIFWAAFLKTINEEKIKCPQCGKKQATEEELHKMGSLSLKKKLSLKSKDRRGSGVLEHAVPAS